MMIALTNVSFSYKKISVLENITFSLERNSIVGIIGDNGSGKTTFLKIIGNMLIPQKGTVSIERNGRNTNVCGLIETPHFWNELTGRETLQYYLTESSSDTVKDALKRWELGEHIDMPVRKYSLGMRQKLAIICVLYSEEDILLFDEPTNSLDSRSKRIFFSEVRYAAERGKSIIIVSHETMLLTRYCDKVYSVANKHLKQLGQLKFRTVVSYLLRFLREDEAKLAQQRLEAEINRLCQTEQQEGISFRSDNEGVKTQFVCSFIQRYAKNVIQIASQFGLIEAVLIDESEALEP